MPLIRWFRASLLMLFLLLLSGCGEESGPGMIVNWKCMDKTNEIWLESIRYPSGVVHKRSTSITVRSPATESLAPDNRVIPEWVELSWIEPKNYENNSTAPSIEDQLKVIHQLPLKTQRVQVGSRIPKDVVAQAVEAVNNRKTGHLPEKGIRLFFSWKGGRVYLRWHLERSIKAPEPGKSYTTFHTTVLASGGDQDYPEDLK